MLKYSIPIAVLYTVEVHAAFAVKYNSTRPMKWLLPLTVIFPQALHLTYK